VATTGADPMATTGQIAAFAGHRHTDSTLRYIHLSGRELVRKLGQGMQHIHAQRVQALTSGEGTEASG
jgi:integrase/recombinase XerD